MIHLYTDRFIPGTNIVSQWDKSIRDTLSEYCSDLRINLSLLFTDDGLSEERFFNDGDTVVISLHTNVPHSDVCWSVDRIRSLRKKCPNIAIHVLFGDMELASQQVFAFRVYRIVDYIHYTGKYLPIVQKIFKKFKYHQPILGFRAFRFYPKLDRPSKFLGYTGRIRADRQALIEYLATNTEYKVNCSGGEREESLTYENYLKSLCNSYLNLSFSRVGFSHVVNLRPFELFFLGMNFCEMASIETIRFFSPVRDYVLFFNKSDLTVKLEKMYVDRDASSHSFFNNAIDDRIFSWSSHAFWSDCLEGRSVQLLSVRSSLSGLSLFQKAYFGLLFGQQYVLFLVVLFRYFFVTFYNFLRIK